MHGTNVREGTGWAVTIKNTKCDAWDTIGSLYWNAGYSGGPSPAGIAQYLEGVDASTKVAVLGASTVELIRAAIDRGANVTVFEFAPRMCEQLAAELGARRCRIVLQDITQPLISADCRQADVVCADRLINRFTQQEADSAFTQVLRLLSDGGELRAAIRLGLYARDLPLIEEGRRRGTLHEFFDEQQGTIDYGKAGDILAQHIAPHGQIPQAILLEFYRRRGQEKRFAHADIVRCAEAARDAGRRLSVNAIEDYVGTPDDTFYHFRVVAPNATGGRG